jgi:hypothetical protein
MEVIDKILSEWSFRCHDGIVDMNDPIKKSILEEILKEFNIDETDVITEGDETYDKVIKNTLKVEEIPQVQNSYELGKNTNVNGEDAKTFKQLYPVAPPKKDQSTDSAGSKGSGNGEISLYWLFAYQKNPLSVTGNPGRGKADLIIDGKGVEVKAYDSKTMAFGRIGSDKENLELLNTLFGLHSLLSSIDSTTDKDKQPNPLRFSKEDIVDAFKTFIDFANNDVLKELSKNYPLIANIYAKVDNLIKKLPKNTNINNAEDAAGALMKNILLRKTNEKIGSDGYIVNVSPNGDLKYFNINLDLIEKTSNEKILKNTSINQGALNINPEELFK